MLYFHVRCLKQTPPAHADPRGRDGRDRARMWMCARACPLSAERRARARRAPPRAAARRRHAAISPISRPTCQPVSRYFTIHPRPPSISAATFNV
eukprot:scaffold130111_cov67-Phaeocystis_antarctica.AAC.8